MRGLSIDIGIHNMAFYIEEFDIEKIQSLSCPKVLRYDSNGCATERWKEVLNKVYNSGKKIFIDKKDLSDKKGTAFDIQIFINLTTYLDSHIKDFDQCSFILIEQQMKTNPMAQRLEQHCISWFTFIYGSSKSIILFPSKNKTQVLGAPKKIFIKNKKGVEKLCKMPKPQRKKWACDEAFKILNIRNDLETIKFIFCTNKTKKDDLSDTIVQLNAFKIKCFIDKILK